MGIRVALALRHGLAGKRRVFVSGPVLRLLSLRNT